MTGPTRRVAQVLLALTVLSLPAASVSAGDKSFNSVVNHLKSNYQAKRQGFFGLGVLTRVAVKVIRPAGVKSFKLAMLKDLQLPEDPSPTEFSSFVRGAVSPAWQPLVQVYSRRSQQWTCVYAQQRTKDMRLLIVTRNQREAFVAEASLDPDKLIKFMEEPRILGIKTRNGD